MKICLYAEIKKKSCTFSSQSSVFVCVKKYKWPEFYKNRKPTKSVITSELNYVNHSVTSHTSDGTLTFKSRTVFSINHIQQRFVVNMRILLTMLRCSHCYASKSVLILCLLSGKNPRSTILQSNKSHSEIRRVRNYAEGRVLFVLPAAFSQHHGGLGLEITIQL